MCAVRCYALTEKYLCREVKAIAAQFVTNHTVHVFVGGVEEKMVANKSITQHVDIVGPHDKMPRLTQILRSKPQGTRIIIFCSTKRMCDQLSSKSFSHTCFNKGFGKKHSID